MKPDYKSSYISSEGIFDHLLGLDWLSVTEARKEYFMSNVGGISYTYGSGVGQRTYTSMPYTSLVKVIRDKLNADFSCDYNVCFLNRYDNEKNQLGWYSDDSAEMNSDHPIAVISFGAEREIQWKLKDFKGHLPMDQKQILQNGSLFIMPAGFQENHVHRVPKTDKICGTRISLTFRNYK